jgi:hypothetical protein
MQMLNEVMEVEAYLRDPQSENPRIKLKLLLDDFHRDMKLNGIGDILALIVSQYLSRFAKEQELHDALIKRAILVMRVWCGFEDDVSEEELTIAKEEEKEWFATYPDAEGWLKKYYYKHLKPSAPSWGAYSKKWKEILNTSLVYQAKTQCYENFLAQAVAMVAPKEQYLLMRECKNGWLPDVTNANGKLPDKRKRNNIFKLLVAYKILERFQPGQEWVLIQTNRVLAWLGMESDRSERWCTEILWRGEPLIYIESGSDYKKFKVNSDFLKEMDVQILVEEPECIPDGYQVYCDGGHGKDNELKLLRI